MQKKGLSKITPQVVFYIVALAGILGFLLYAFLVHDTSTFNWLVMEHNGNWEFADYFAHVFFGEDLLKTYNSFDVDPCFPPLAYLFYHFMYCINPAGEAAAGRADVMNYSYNMFLFLVYTVISAVLFVYAVQFYMQSHMKLQAGNESEAAQRRTGQSMLLTVTVLFSAPFFGSAIERGNAVFPVCAMLLLALAFKDSENKVLKELALILIAVAANFKLYPAILGLLYLKEKRYKEAFRLVLYGGLLFVLPFVFFGGIEGIKDYLVIMYLMEGRSIERLTTVRGVITSAFMAAGGEGMKWTGHAVGRVAENIYLVLALAGFWVSRNKWKSLLLLISPMVIYVSSAYRYTTIYLFLALICFLCMLQASEQKYTIMDYVYAILFGLLFTIPIWMIGHELENFMYLIVYILVVAAMVDVAVEFAGRLKKKKQKTIEE